MTFGIQCMRHFGETLEQERRHGFVFPIPGGAIAEQPTLVRDSLFGLNKLAGVKFNDASQLFHRPLTAVQSVAVDNAGAAVAEAGECPSLCGRDALKDMMKSHPTYGEPSTLAPFDAAKLKILFSLGRPKTIETLLPPHVIPLLNRWKTHIELSAEEVRSKLDASPECCPKRPYWDPILQKSRDVRTKLIVDLWKVGVVTFRTSIKSSIGLFFVKKKTPEWIRMVVDCRISNVHHRQPPVTRLGSPSCFGDLEMSPEVLKARLGRDCNQVGWGAELDVADCFYQFEMKQLAKWFGIDDPRKTADWAKAGVDITEVYDEDLETMVLLNDDTVVYPVIGAMPMGWTWALFFANETVAAIARATAPERPLECREKLPTPQLWEGETITSTYVDNVAVFGAHKVDVIARMDSLTKAFANHDIPVVWTQQEPLQCFETVGVILDFRNRVVRNKPSRLWKAYLAGRELCRRTKVRGDAVEVWTGHVTSLFRLSPSLLSVFSVIYRFNAVCRGKRVRLWPAVRAEIMQASSLLWFARAKLDGSFVNQVDMGDSSTSGYAMLTRSFAEVKIQEVARVREKWRFIPMPDDFKSAIEFFNRPGNRDEVESREHIKAFVRAGVGPNTEYGVWLQQALVDGNWLQTSPIVSQFKAVRKRREDVEVPALVEPIPSDMVSEGSYKLLWMRKWRNPDERINIKEGRVLLSSLKRAARVSSQCGTKKLTFSDNLSAVLAFEKGRSSSAALNRLCKSSAAIQNALQIKWRIRHLETKRNLADAPSRGKWFRTPVPDPHVILAEPVFSPSKPSVIPSVSARCKNHLSLDALVPPPGLGWTAVHHMAKNSTCDSKMSSWHPASGACNDHGRPASSSTSVKKAKGVKVFWELFSGEGNLSKAMRSHRLFVHTPLDIKQDPSLDLTIEPVQRQVRQWIVDGHVDYLHMGTPCTVFSRARRGIKNFTKARFNERIGCELAFFSCELARLCSKLDVKWSIENPQSSRIWSLDCIQDLFGLPDAVVIDFPMCVYGQPFKKPTRLLSNCSSLVSLAATCPHHKHAEVLKGRTWSPTYGWTNKTTLAGAYPPSLCNKWARVIRDDPLVRTHDKKKLGPDFGQVFKPCRGQSVAPKTCTEQDKQFPITSEIPGLLDEVAFGHHSKAEIAQRKARKIRARQKKKA